MCISHSDFLIKKEEGGKVTLQRTNLINNISNQLLKVNSNSAKAILTVFTLDMRMALDLCCLPPKNTLPSLIMRKASGKSQMRDSLHHTCPIILKTILSSKRRHLRKKASQNQEDTWQLNVIWYPGWDLGIRTLGEDWGNLNTLVNNNV